MSIELDPSWGVLAPWANQDRGRVPLPTAFFDRDPREVAPDLLGCLLSSRAGGVETGGVIVETEAYLGRDDPGSHAATRGVTKRNAVMYGPPGTAYVYFTYGNHHMLNLVCCRNGTAGAVLVRALEPVYGLVAMRDRRHGRHGRDITNGPGKLAAALGVDLTDNGTVLADGRLIVYDGAVPPGEIAVSGRIGLSAGHELHMRYYVRASEFVSRGRTDPSARDCRTDGQPA
ncbi:MAG: DNA-3-methyladenine glycosylase [Actinomycetota bacterium]|nr:DNA-3-methyladenine glycosylase [Actinomycetota bacterium]